MQNAVRILIFAIVLGIVALFSTAAWNVLAPPFGGPQLSIWQGVGAIWLLTVANFWHNNGLTLFTREPNGDH